MGICFGGRLSDTEINYALPSYPTDVEDKSGVGGILGRFVLHIGKNSEDNDSLFEAANELGVTIAYRNPEEHFGVYLFPKCDDADKTVEELIARHEKSLNSETSGDQLYGDYFKNKIIHIKGRCSLTKHGDVNFLGENYLNCSPENDSYYKTRQQVLRISGLDSKKKIEKFLNNNGEEKWKDVRDISYAKVNDNWTHFGYCAAMLVKLDTNSKQKGCIAFAFTAAANWDYDLAEKGTVKKWISLKNDSKNHKHHAHTEMFCCDRLVEWLRSKYLTNNNSSETINVQKKGKEKLNEIKKDENNLPLFQLWLRFAIEKPSPCAKCVHCIKQMKAWLHYQKCCLKMPSIASLSCKDTCSLQ